MSNPLSNLSGAELVLAIIALLILAVLLTLAQAWVVMILWNWLIPAVFHGPTVTFLQSLVAVVLLDIVGSFFRSR